MLGGYAVLITESNRLNHQESKRIDKVRMEDIHLLETLFKNRLTKTEALVLLNSNVEKEKFFDKPSEGGIGVGSMFLIFNSIGQLSKIETDSFEGP